MRKILPADTLTPILAYMRVQGEHKVILESIPREKENARFSIVAADFADGADFSSWKSFCPTDFTDFHRFLWNLW